MCFFTWRGERRGRAKFLVYSVTIMSYQLEWFFSEGEEEGQIFDMYIQYRDFCTYDILLFTSFILLWLVSWSFS